MSQHDLDIANQTFPATRTDLNNALQALGSTSSGATAPSTTYANQLWYDTANNKLYIRNEDNDANIEIMVLDQTNDTVEYFKSDSIRTALIEFTDGTDALTVASSGALTTSSTLDVDGNELILDSDGDTSITADTDDQIDIRINGADDFAFKANSFEVQTGSNIDMNGTELILDADGDTSITSDTDDQVDVKIGGTDRLVIKSTGEIETVSSASDNTLKLQSTNAGTTGAGLKLYHNSASPADNDTISIITSQGRNDNSEDINYSEIHTQVLDVSDGTEDARMEFHLMRAGTLTENMRLNETGDCHFDGDVIAFSTSVSDVALKSDIEMIPNALDKIDQIKGYTFTRHNGQKSAGIIAQELEKVLPEAVREKELALVDGKTYKTVEYDAIHGLLINCIKELKEQIKELKDGITK